MKISKQARRDARQVFRSCLAQGILDEGKVRQAVELVLRSKPRGYLPLLSQFHRLVKLELARRTAQVESATPMEPAMQAQVKSELERKYGAGLNFIFAQKPELLGGLRIQVGGDVYNGSIQGRLAALQESL